MNTRPHHPTLNPAADARRGAALLLVLSCLTLLSILAVAFLSSISVEVESSSVYASSSDVKQRAQTAVNMVIAQIQDASSSSAAWASQPGLIRTFDDQGNPASAYKLYSSREMVAGSSFDPNDLDDVPTDWKSRPAEYTDLNQPVLMQDDDSGTFQKDGVKYSPQYPILDPGALGIVKGFSIDGNTAPPDYAAVDPTTDNPAPMPVQWLYMLKDGSLRAINPSTQKIQDATSSNPVVARLAFWTDDDTCKVNINTAAGDEWDNTMDPGSFMDMPRARGDFELTTLANNQPVSHEYQRYPGHPATTYLSAVFPTLTRTQIGDIIPRVQAGGSEGGTKATFTGITSAVSSLPLSDGMPLYASVDELRYVRSTSSRDDQTLFTPEEIEQAKFFLTAVSRSPEVNLFNQPRVSLWPEPANSSTRTAFDKTIAFCSTVGGQVFYFVRADPTSPTADYLNYPRNQELYNYLKDLTSEDVPGFGGNFLDKYADDHDQVLTEIFDYIRSGINLLDATGALYAAPAGTTIKDLENIDLRKAPAGVGHVIPIEIGDTRGFGRSMTLFSPILVLAGLQAEVDLNGAAVDDNKDGLLTGTGKPEYADKAKLRTKKVQAIFAMDTFSPSLGPVRFVPDLVFKVTGLDKLSLDGTNMGFPASAEINLNHYAQDNDFAWGGYVNHAAFFRKDDGSNKGASYELLGGILAIDKEYKKDTLMITGGDDIKVEIYAKGSSDLIQSISLKFPEAPVPVPTVRGIYKQSYTSGQDPTIPLNPPSFPDAVAACVDKIETPGVEYLVNTPYGIINFGYNSGSKEGQTIFHVSRSLVPGYGDMRLIAGKKDVSKDAFVPARGYDTPTDSNYRTLWKVKDGEETSGGMVAASASSTIGGGHLTTTGKLVYDVTYDQHIGSNFAPVHANDYGPAVASKITSADLTGIDGNPHPGDWDTGMGGVAVDGPYINKADEGETGSYAYLSYQARMSIGSLFSPNRQAPSPVMFGSLSTGVKRDLPWQTLLFCPNPPAKNQHPGLASPPDHLLLDLFWMPVVEPYAISEPFSTAGKINMNYQIVPFTNIERSTGLQALLRSVRVTAIPNGDGLVYKTPPKTGVPTPQLYRLPLDIDETLKGFQDRFDANDPFRSASEICEMFLVPANKGATIANIQNWWDGYKLTGDNLRENPYNLLYSRLTTKSNTYTVHVRVQTLKKNPNTSPDEWKEDRDRITGEYRGSFGIERYLDPNLKAYTTGTPLTAYKFRTLTTKHFTP